MEEFPSIFTKRAEGIIDSAIEKVRGRVQELADKGGFSIAELDGSPAGVLQFFLTDRDMRISSKEEHLAFFNRLLINDSVLKDANSRIIEDSGLEAYIEIEPRKDW